MKTEIYAVAHGNNRVAECSDCLSVMAGAALDGTQVPRSYQRDDTGDNISEKNLNYCELTVLYWVWKNRDADILGLCHYRRFFASLSNKGQILRNDEAEHLLAYYDVILPRARNYFIETNYSQYASAHHAIDLELTRKIIEEKYPEQVRSFDRRMNMTMGHRFNMLIMRREHFEKYCEWLFSLLFELEKRLDISCYNDMDRRVFGLVSERLLDVWIDANDLRCCEVPYIMTENERIAAKGAKMIIRKISSGSNRQVSF